MLPEKFCERMKKMLGDGWDAFAAELDKSAVRGVRINTLKLAKERLTEVSDDRLLPISYAPDGFILDGGEHVGASAAHHAGIIYMQDPAAMASVCCVDIPEGAFVLDMCAAPGGKSGQAAARIGEGGFLFSNEFVPKRAKITVGNFERLGIKNAFVTSLDTAKLPLMFSAFFDFVIADVPCSGEGMFRKSGEAISEWSEENVLNCSIRQEQILNNAAPLVKDGGYLIYSTCTYSLEENEMQVFAFLEKHPDYELCPVRDELCSVTADGINYLGTSEGEKLKKCRRFYPHISRGEGQFVALLRRKNCTDMPTVLYKNSAQPLDKTDARIVDSFLADTLCRTISAKAVRVGENIVLISHGVPVPPNSVFSAGVLLGEIRKGILLPHHQFFSAYGALFKRKIEVGDADATHRYLRGEEIENTEGFGGWCVITYHGAALGGGKAVGDRVKNHYPKGLRNP